MTPNLSSHLLYKGFFFFLNYLRKYFYLNILFLNSMATEPNLLFFSLHLSFPLLLIEVTIGIAT